MMQKALSSIEEVPYCFFLVIHQISRSDGLKNQRFESNLSKITRPVAAIKSLRFALLIMFHIYINPCEKNMEWLAVAAS